MVGWRDLMQSTKLRQWLRDSYSFTLRASSGTDFHSFHSDFEPSKPPRSTQTQPSVPIHFVPPLMSEWPPAMVMVTLFEYFSSQRYRVAVFQTASLGGNSPLPSISTGPPRLSRSSPQWAMSQWWPIQSSN